jgi:hypothetical protein
VTGVRGEEKLVHATECRVIAGILRKKYPRLFELHASLSLIICERYHLYRYRRDDVTKTWQDSPKNRGGLAESSADSVRVKEESVRGREDSVRGRVDSVRDREDSMKRTASSVMEEAVVEDSVRIMTDSGTKHEAAPPAIIVLPEARSTETETRIEKEIYLANKRKYHASATAEELQRELGKAGDSEDVHRIIQARIRYGRQCCGSVMFIPDPNFFSIPDPYQRI